MSEKDSEELSLIRQVLEFLTSPRTFFSSKLEKPSLLKAAALILVIAIIAAWASYNYMGKLPLTQMAERLDSNEFPTMGPPSGLVNSEQLRQASMIVSAITGLTNIFGGWLISSILLHSFSKAQGGKGAFRSMLTLTGYASIPLLIQHSLRLVDSFSVSQEEVRQLVGRLQISADPFLNATANAAIDILSVFRIWSIVLLVVAVSVNYKTSTCKSTVTAIITYALMIFLSAFLPIA
jgi:hypothetical protein